MKSQAAKYFDPALIIFFIFIHFHSVGQTQDLSIENNRNFSKCNSFQVINYKPPAAKRGKNGNERFVLFQLIKGPKSGQTGKEGKPGPDLSVKISEITVADTNLLKIIVRSNTRTDTFFVNPRYGQLKIIADGGDGGQGGSGEDGGGSHASGGRGGNGGTIAPVFDSTATGFYNCTCLIFSNEGGAGGWNGDHTAPRQADPGEHGPPIYYKAQQGKILRIQYFK